jgi:hypothetical protein
MEASGNEEMRTGCGGLEVWRCGGVEVWRCGGVEAWRRGGVKTVGSRDKCQGEGEKNKSIAKWRRVGSE